ncbi:MAG TPA: SDR family NAD(P)-dependent oxidoreductase [Sphingobium sp.]|nr:SDR family NAD(P)-dependent oxidoreductase [Sphingobium sp.]
MPSASTAHSASLDGRLAIVTGGTAGIGLATATQLAELGASVIVASRGKAAGREAADHINKAVAAPRARHLVLDLSSFASIRGFARELGDCPVSLLINNAGVMGGPLRRTQEGFEWHLGINFMGPFLLSRLLAANLARGTNARIVQLSSGAHVMAPFDFEDPNYEHKSYEWQMAYWQSKTACALFAVAAQARFAGQGIEAFSASPGIVETNLLSSMDEDARVGMLRDLAAVVRTPAQAAANSIYAATSPDLVGKGGAYIEDCAIAPQAAPDALGGWRPMRSTLTRQSGSGRSPKAG